MLEFRTWLEALDKLPTRYDQGGKVSLYHFTHIPPNKNGAIILDPKSASDPKNRHSYSQSEFRAASTPRVFFYLNPKDADKDNGPNPTTSYLYKVDVPIDDLYSLSGDPLNLKEKSFEGTSSTYDIIKKRFIKDESNQKFNLDKYLSLIQRTGHKGTFYNNKAFNAVAIFVPIRAQILRSPFGKERPRAI